MDILENITNILIRAVNYSRHGYNSSIDIKDLDYSNKNSINITFVTLLKILFGVGIGTRKYGVVDTFSLTALINQISIR